MILSLFVAFIVTPWASVRLLKQPNAHSDKEEIDPMDKSKVSFLDRLYISFAEMLLGKKMSAFYFGVISIILLLLSFSFIYFKAVKVKMLPFDNKNEFQVIIDYPPDTPLEKSVAWSKELSLKLLKEPEIKKIQIYGGESAPFSFSGMVKHTFLRNEEYMNDLQILLSDKGKRKESSHKIIEKLRPIIAEFGKEKNAVTKVLEIPPGPPVMSTMVAEVYGPTENDRRRVAKEILEIFASEKSVVDLDEWRKEKERISDENKEKKKQQKKEEELADDEDSNATENEEETKNVKKYFNPINRRHHMVLLAKSNKGLENLFRLVSRSFKDGFYRYPRIDRKMLKEYGEDIIATSACIGGVSGRQGGPMGGRAT
jgi:multidrug efflux pump subunit AcrB